MKIVIAILLLLLPVVAGSVDVEAEAEQLPDMWDERTNCDPEYYEDKPGTTLKDWKNPINDPIGKYNIWYAGLIPMYDETGEYVNPSSGMNLYQTVKFAIDYTSGFFSAKMNDEVYPLFLKYQFKPKFRRALPINESHESYIEIVKFVVNCMNSNVQIIIGPSSPHQILLLNQFAGDATKMTFLTHASTSLYGDHLRYKEKKEDYLFQTVPSDEFRYAALRLFLKKLEWNFPFFVQSQSLEEQSLHFLERRLPDICYGRRYLLNPHGHFSLERMEWILNHLNKNERVKVLILFTDVYDSKYFLRAIKNLNLGNRFVLLFAYGSSLNYEVIKGSEDIALGSFALDPGFPIDDEFYMDEYKEVYEEYFLRLTPETERTIAFHLYWEQTFECRLKSNILQKHRSNRHFYKKPCNGSERFTKGKGFYPNPMTLQQHVHALDFITINLHQVLNKHLANISCNIPNNCTQCPWLDIRCIRKGLTKKLNDPTRVQGGQMLEHITAVYHLYNFQKIDNRYEHVKVGNWSLKLNRGDTFLHRDSDEYKYKLFLKKIFWRNAKVGEMPNLMCSNRCKPGFYKKYDKENICCWECRKCPYRSVVQENKCKKCKYDEKADLRRNVCAKLPIVEITFASSIIGTAIGALAIAGCLIVAVITIIFVVNNNKRIVKSFGRELGYAILFGAAVLFGSVFTYITKPTTGSCYCRTVLPTLSFNICSSSMFLQSLRLYRVFIRNRRSVRHIRFISPDWQLVMLSFLVIAHVSISMAWFSEGLAPQKIVSDNKEYVVLKCQYGSRLSQISHLFVSWSLAFLPMVLCLALAIQLRSVPKSFKERINGLTASLTLACFIVYGTIQWRFDISDNHFEELSSCVFYLICGLIFISCQFAPRVYALLKYGDIEWVGSLHKETPLSRASFDQDDEINKNVDGIDIVPDVDVKLPNVISDSDDDSDDESDQF